MLASEPARLIRIDLRTHKRRKLLLDTDQAGDLAIGRGAAWITLDDIDQLARVDLRTFNVSTVAVGRGPMGVALQGPSVWVANRASSTVSRVDARSERLREELDVPLNPYELAADGEGVWVTSLAVGKLSRVTAPAG